MSIIYFYYQGIINTGDIMCTAITYKTDDSYFGRNLDLEYSYDEKVTITPRNFRFDFRKKESISSHYAIMGMATVVNNYPLYYDGINEHGLGMAGLNFPDNAYFGEEKEGKDNISPFEFVPWILSQCRNVDEAEKLLGKINLCNIDFSEEMTVTPLHWMFADKVRSITVESVKDGLKIYENKFGVLTNNPPFDYHMTYICDFLNLTPYQVKNYLYEPYSRGLGAKGLPGDFSSTSRFVRAVFTKFNSVSDKGEGESVSQFFHILTSVEHVKGCVRLENGKNMITIYSSCMNLNKGIYYYTTYENRCISAIDMHRCDLDGSELIKYPLEKSMIINKQN